MTFCLIDIYIVRGCCSLGLVVLLGYFITCLLGFVCSRFCFGIMLSCERCCVVNLFCLLAGCCCICFDLL